MQTMTEKKLTQHQRILARAKDGWLCQKDFREQPIQSWSPHKRRTDIEQGRYTELDGSRGISGKYEWEERACIHGISGSKDFRLTTKPPTNRLF